MVIKINAHLLPIKIHYFCFMAAMGPILPQLSVFGKEMGISSEVMGSIQAILPLCFLLAKPLVGLIVDICRKYRKSIFIGIIITMSFAYALLQIIPVRQIENYNVPCHDWIRCNGTELDALPCDNLKSLTCNYPENTDKLNYKGILSIMENENMKDEFCLTENISNICNNNDTVLTCSEDFEKRNSCMYQKWTFWFFIVFMAIGTISFNVANSLSDAVCFDLIGDDYNYGKQRVWGTIGFGITALLSGYLVNEGGNFDRASYTPAFIIMLLFTVFDVISCSKIELPIMEAPKNIFKELGNIMNNRHTIIFITFAVFAGIVDGYIVYFLFWYLEDMAVKTNTHNIKLLEGLIVAAETLGGEVIFFSISGKILERFGHAYTFSMCFINYALRLGLMSIIPSPWYLLPIELMLQGPTYALTYTTIVEYANVIAAPGMSATMQGIAAGMDDGFGYCLGSLIGGFLYKAVGGELTMQIFSAFALICSISHLVLYKVFLQHHHLPNQKEPEYKTPAEAALAVYDTSTTSDIHCV